MKELSMIDAFRALNEIDDEVNEIPLKKKKKVNEAFSVSLNGTGEQIDQAKEELIKAEEEPVLKVIDADADTLDHLKKGTDYVGQMILQCNVCKALKFIDTDKLVADPENDENVNVEDECPNCHSTGKGFKVIGQVGAAEGQKAEQEQTNEQPAEQTETEENESEELPALENDVKSENNGEATFDNDVEEEQPTEEEPEGEESEADLEQPEEEESEQTEEEPKKKKVDKHTQAFDDTPDADDTEDLELPKLGDEVDEDDVDKDDTEEEEEEKKNESLEEVEASCWKVYKVCEEGKKLIQDNIKDQAAAEVLIAALKQCNPGCDYLACRGDENIEDAESVEMKPITEEDEEEKEILTIEKFLELVKNAADIKRVKVYTNEEDPKLIFNGPVNEMTPSVKTAQVELYNIPAMILEVNQEKDENHPTVKDFLTLYSNEDEKYISIDNAEDESEIFVGSKEEILGQDIADKYFVTSVEIPSIVEFGVVAKENQPEALPDESQDEIKQEQVEEKEALDLTKDIIKENNMYINNLYNPRSNEYAIKESIINGQDLASIYNVFVKNGSEKLKEEFTKVTGYVLKEAVYADLDSIKLKDQGLKEYSYDYIDAMDNKKKTYSVMAESLDEAAEMIQTRFNGGTNAYNDVRLFNNDAKQFIDVKVKDIRESKAKVKKATKLNESVSKDYYYSNNFEETFDPNRLEEDAEDMDRINYIKGIVSTYVPELSNDNLDVEDILDELELICLENDEYFNKDEFRPFVTEFIKDNCFEPVVEELNDDIEENLDINGEITEDTTIDRLENIEKEFEVNEDLDEKGMVHVPSIDELAQKLGEDTNSVHEDANSFDEGINVVDDGEEIEIINDDPEIVPEEDETIEVVDESVEDLPDQVEVKLDYLDEDNREGLKNYLEKTYNAEVENIDDIEIEDNNDGTAILVSGIIWRDNGLNESFYGQEERPKLLKGPELVEVVNQCLGDFIEDYGEDIEDLTAAIEDNLDYCNDVYDKNELVKVIKQCLNDKSYVKYMDEDLETIEIIDDEEEPLKQIIKDEEQPETSTEQIVEDNEIVCKAEKVMAAYQNANKWLDSVKEAVYQGMNCPFFSSYIHGLAHTMPGRFDKFGDILHTVNIEIPYPTTEELQKKPKNITEAFETIFKCLDDIKETLNDFIKCTDEKKHGMACAAETLLNDIESEYPTLYRLKGMWENAKDDVLGFDKFVMQYLDHKDKLLESIRKERDRKLNEDVKHCKNRKELSEAIKKCKNNNKPYKISRSITEGFRYDVILVKPEEEKEGEIQSPSELPVNEPVEECPICKCNPCKCHDEVNPDICPECGCDPCECEDIEIEGVGKEELKELVREILSELTTSNLKEEFVDDISFLSDKKDEILEVLHEEGFKPNDITCNEEDLSVVVSCNNAQVANKVSNFLHDKIHEWDQISIDGDKVVINFDKDISESIQEDLGDEEYFEPAGSELMVPNQVEPKTYSPEEQQLMKRMMEVGKNTAQAIKDTYDIDVDPRLVVADIVRDLRLIKGDINPDQLPEGPAGDATREMFQNYTAFTNFVDELVQAFGGQPLNLTPVGRVKIAFRQLNGPSFDRESIYQAIDSDAFRLAAQNGQVPMIAPDDPKLLETVINEDVGDYTISINAGSDILTDENGNTIKFNSAEAAQAYIDEEELEDAEVTRQYGKADDIVESVDPETDIEIPESVQEVEEAEFDEESFDNEINEYFNENYDNAVIYKTKEGSMDKTGRIVLEGTLKGLKEDKSVERPIKFLLEPINNINESVESNLKTYKVTNNVSDEKFEFSK